MKKLFDFVLNSKVAQIAIAILITSWVVPSFFHNNIKFEDLALGAETKIYLARKDTHLVHFSDFNNFTQIENSWKHFGKKNVILCLGNSQTHSINQMKKNEVNYVQILSDSIKDKEVITFTLPNISLQEMLLSFEYLRNKMPVKMLVIPIFMDDLREDEIRTDVFFKRLNTEKFRIIPDTGLVEQKINKAVNSNAAVNSDIAGLNNTPQEKVESYLNTKLDNYSEIWRSRADIRGNFFNYLYELRNTLFGINAQTKRAMIPQTYNNNIAAFKRILEICQQNNISVITYIPPIRNDVKIPYDLLEYEKFKDQIQSTCSDHRNVNFLNLEDIVPAQYWGVKDGTNLSKTPELDFMHFQSEGHKLLFSKIYPEIKMLNTK